MKISAVIPTRNRPTDLARAVASVLRQARLPAQLLIIDQSLGLESKNAITALVSEPAPGFELIYVHDPAIAGLVAAKEYSLGVSNGDVVMFLEDDVVLEENYIQNLGQAFVDNPEMMGACGVVLDAPDTSMFYHRLFHLFHRGIFHDRRVGVHGNPVAWTQQLIPSAYLSGGVSAYRRAVFAKVKFDTRNDFFMLEDIDFSTRAVREFGAGRFFINTRARLAHLASPVNRARLAGRYERKLREFLVFYKKNRGQTSSLASLLWLLVGLSLEAIIAAARARHIGPISGSIKGLLDGIKWRVRA